MKKKLLKSLEIIIYSINYILISYALSNMSMLLKASPIFILFFASEIWVMGVYVNKIQEITENRVLSWILLAVCFALHIGMVYFIGRVLGDIVPFKNTI